MGDKLKIKHTRMTFDEWNRSIVKKNFGWPTGSCG